MLRLALVLVLITAGRAHGEGAAPQPLPRCKVGPMKGTPLFEARYAGTAPGKQVVTKLYANGSFSRVMTLRPKARAQTQVSCIEKIKLENLVAMLKDAPWLTTKTEDGCPAASVEATEIYVLGKQRFTAKTCNHLTLDDQSDLALGAVTAAVGPFGIDLVDDTTSPN